MSVIYVHHPMYHHERNRANKAERKMRDMENKHREEIDDMEHWAKKTAKKAAEEAAKQAAERAVASFCFAGVAVAMFCCSV